LGDLNSDFKTTNGRKLIETCISQNLQCHINSPTRISKITNRPVSSTCLDQIISNIPKSIRNCQVIPPISTNDHCTVTSEIDFRVAEVENYERHVWLYDKGDYQGFRDELSSYDWVECLGVDNLDLAVAKWTNKVLSTAGKYVPNQTMRIRPRDSPWFANHLRQLRKRVIRAYKRAKSSPNDNNWILYKTLNREYHNNLDLAENDYNYRRNDRLMKTTNSKAWWRLVKEILGRGSKETYPPMFDERTDSFLTSSVDKADLFNRYFLSQTDIDSSTTSLPSPVEEHLLSIDNIVVSETEVSDQLKCLDISKASGDDGLSGRILREAGYSLVPSLTVLFNKSLQLGKFPADWKKALIVPIHKKDDKSVVSNYRPISLLSVTSKIMERIIFKHIYNFFHSNSLLTVHQSGFRPNDSTVNQLAYLYHIISKALDERKEIRIVFCDVSKAFDKVWHNGVLFKLDQLGINGNLHTWIQDYITNRKQRVVIQGHHSEWGDIKAGIPQGSVLGPLLFLVYINNIVNEVNCGIKLFADDTLIYTIDDGSKNTTISLNQNLENINSWAKKWLIKFNPTKTHLMTISNLKNTRLNNNPIRLDGTVLENVTNHTHLGLVLNNKLSWTPHIDHILEGVGKLNDIFISLKRKLNRSTLNTMYFSFVRPKLEYACVVWDNCTEHDKERLENMQLNFARSVTGAKRGTSHQCIYDEVQWPKLSDRRQDYKKVFMFKLVNDLAPPYLCDILPQVFKDSVDYDLRNRDDFRYLDAKTEKHKNSLFPSIVKMWNELSKEVKNVNTVNEFRRKAVTRADLNHLYFGFVRQLNIAHAQMRMQCSNLNYHLFNLHVVESPSCRCSYKCEDVNHYLLQCPLYAIERHKLLSVVRKICEPNFKLLLYGCDKLCYEKNRIIFKCVETFILETNRLL